MVVEGGVWKDIDVGGSIVGGSGERDVGGLHRVSGVGTSTPWKGVLVVVKVKVEAFVSSVCGSGVCICVRWSTVVNDRPSVGGNTGKGVISVRHVEPERVRGDVGMGVDVGHDFGDHIGIISVLEASDEIEVDGRVGAGVRVGG